MHPTQKHNSRVFTAEIIHTAFGAVILNIPSQYASRSVQAEEMAQL